jgi:hypothetical protein
MVDSLRKLGTLPGFLWNMLKNQLLAFPAIISAQATTASAICTACRYSSSSGLVVTRITTHDGIIRQGCSSIDGRWNGYGGRKKVQEGAQVVRAWEGDDVGEQNGLDGLFAGLLGVKAEVSNIAPCGSGALAMARA